MADQLEIERRLVGDATTKTLLKEMFKIPGNRNRALISVALMVFQQMTGVNAIVSRGTFTRTCNAVLTRTRQNYYAPQIFGNLGMDKTNSSLFATGIYGVVKFVSCAVFLTFVADSLGRRRSLIWTAAAQGTVLYIVGIYGRVQPPEKGEPVSGLHQQSLRGRQNNADSFDR